MERGLGPSEALLGGKRRRLPSPPCRRSNKATSPKTRCHRDRNAHAPCARRRRCRRRGQRVGLGHRCPDSTDLLEDEGLDNLIRDRADGFGDGEGYCPGGQCLEHDRRERHGTQTPLHSGKREVSAKPIIQGAVTGSALPGAENMIGRVVSLCCRRSRIVAIAASSRLIAADRSGISNYNRPMRRLTLAASLALSVCAHPALAWGPVGHRITGAIADENLSGLSRANLRLLT